MRYLTARKQVEGLGSAKSGTDHFIHQRLSAIALVVLLPLFLIVVAPLIFQEPEVVRLAFSTSIWPGLITASTALVVGLHVAQGLQVVIEDYTEGMARVSLLIAMKIGTLLITLGAVWAAVLLSLS